MNKVIVTMICIIVIVGAIFTAMLVGNYGNKNNVKEEIIKVGDVNEDIIDECTEEYNEIISDEILQANSEEEKISPNCVISLKKYYSKCGHTISEFIELPSDLVNKNESDLKEKYESWKVEKYSSTEIILYKEFTGECGQHYIVKESDGKIIINRILENGEEVEFEKTEISVEYLTDTDKSKIESGIKVNGKQELNQLIEDYE